MKSLIIIISFFTLMSQSFATDTQLSTDFLDSDSIEYWYLDAEDK